MTGAEVFAKQNQCTLKKISTISNVSTGKPKVMAKPKLPKSVAVKEEAEEEHRVHREEDEED